LIADGTVSCWGNNTSGQLGDPQLTASNRAVEIEGLDDIVSIEVGLGTTCAITTSGSVLCWGANSAGQLGDGSTSTEPTYEPVQVTGIDDARSLAVGADFACALLDDGSVRCWGANSWGQLGTGDMTPSTTPVQVMDVAGAVRIDAGLRHVCALLGSQRVKCWGLNTVDRVTVYDLYNATEIAVGAYHSCAAHTDRGIVTCWIYPYDARPEEGAIEIELAGNEILALATGGDNYHACVVAEDGGVICWGANGSGQLGDGSTNSPGSGMTVHVAGIDLW
jgi:alpha-tubulin suppressor-like RCC1 family protein